MKKPSPSQAAFIAVVLVVSYYAIKAALYMKNREFKHFSYSEFDSPDLPGSGKTKMSTEFIHKLDRIRERAGFPFIITSGYRTDSHNAAVGGVSNSSHKKGLAVDISAPLDWQKRSNSKSRNCRGSYPNRLGKFIHTLRC